MAGKTTSMQVAIHEPGRERSVPQKGNTAQDAKACRVGGERERGKDCPGGQEYQCCGSILYILYVRMLYSFGPYKYNVKGKMQARIMAITCAFSNTGVRSCFQSTFHLALLLEFQLHISLFVGMKHYYM